MIPGGSAAALALALAVAGPGAPAAPAATSTWTFTPATGTMLGEDGSVANVSAVTAPDGTTRTLPAGGGFVVPWRILGLRKDGAAFVYRFRDICRMTAGHTEPNWCVASELGLAIGEYGWYMPGGEIQRVTIAPVTGRFFGDDDGYFDDQGVFRHLGPGTSTVDGLAVCANQECNGAIFTRPWLLKAVSSEGWVVGTAEDWFYGRTFMVRARPGKIAGSLVDHVDVNPRPNMGEVNDPRGFGNPLVDRAGDVLANPFLHSYVTYSRQYLYPGAGGAAQHQTTCADASKNPLGSLADDGSLLVLPCGVANTTYHRLRVTRDGVQLQVYDGVPLAQARVLDDGWVAAYTGYGTPNQRAVVLIAGRAVDFEQTLGSRSPGASPVLVTINSRHTMIAVARPRKPGDPSVFVGRQRAVLGVGVTGVDGAPDAGVVVGGDPTARAGARDREAAAIRVRTNAKGVARVVVDGGSGVDLTIAGGCFAGPRGCTAKLHVPFGLTAPPDAFALVGRGAAQATVIPLIAPPTTVRLARGKVAVGLRCLRNAGCTGGATLTLKGVRGSAGSGRVSLKRQARGSVAITLTAAAARAIGRTPRAGSVRIVVAGRALVVRLAIRR